MFGRIVRGTVLMLVFLGFSVIVINAQETAAPGKNAQTTTTPAKFATPTPEKAGTQLPASEKAATISPEKKAAIKELFDVTEASQMTEDMSNVMLTNVERGYPQMLIEGGLINLKDKKQDEIEKELMESQMRFNKRFGELYKKRVNFAEVLDEVYLPLYDKYFTVSELKDLVAFYKSTTGQKAIKIMPQLMQESMQKSNDLLVPKIRTLVDELLQEEKDYLAKQAPKAKEQVKAPEPSKTLEPMKTQEPAKEKGK